MEEIIMSSWFNSNKEPLIFSKVSNSDLKLDETQFVYILRFSCWVNEQAIAIAWMGGRLIHEKLGVAY